MHERIAARISILAGLLVLLGAMLDPRISLGLAMAFLVILAGYVFLRNHRRPT